MPDLETPDELAESITDYFGVYQDCECGCQEEPFDHASGCLCRMCFVGPMADRIRKAVENEKALQRLRAMKTTEDIGNIYTGKHYEDTRWAVTVNNVSLDCKPSQAVWNHSPAGFAWGYQGSGPAQLALAILLNEGLPESEAVRLHQVFKAEKIAALEREKGWTIFGSEVWAWIAERTKGEDDGT